MLLHRRVVSQPSPTSPCSVHFAGSRCWQRIHTFVAAAASPTYAAAAAAAAAPQVTVLDVLYTSARVVLRSCSCLGPALARAHTYAFPCMNWVSGGMPCGGYG